MKKNGAVSMIEYSSTSCLNEDNYTFQVFFRILGTNNINHCSRDWNSPKVVSLTKIFGKGTIYNGLVEFRTRECYPILAMQMLHKLVHSTKMLVINLRKTGIIKKADLFSKKFVNNYVYCFEYIKEKTKYFTLKNPLFGENPLKITIKNIKKNSKKEFFRILNQTDMQMHQSELNQPVRR